MINKEDIENLITCKKKNSFANHFQIFLTYDFIKYYGEIRENEILLWHSSYWLRLNYPIFLLEFKDNKLVGLKLEKNPIQRISGIFISTLILSIFIIFFLLLNLKAAIIISIIYLFFSALFVLLIRDRLKTEKKFLINDFRKVLEEIESDNNPFKTVKPQTENEKIKEFTFPKILMRIIIYPFCVGLIYISIVVFFPSDQFIYGLLGIGVGMAYLITDIFLMLKKLQPTRAHKKIAP